VWGDFVEISVNFNMKTMNIYIYKKKKISLFSIDIKMLFFYLQVGDVAELIK